MGDNASFNDHGTAANKTPPTRDYPTQLEMHDAHLRITALDAAVKMSSPGNANDVPARAKLYYDFLTGKV